MTILARIKRAVLSDNFEMSDKARIELFRDGLVEQDIVEVIAGARCINKTIRSRSSRRRNSGREYLHVIVGENLQGVEIYTKGKLVEEDEIETYYFFVSAKCAD